MAASRLRCYCLGLAFFLLTAQARAAGLALERTAVIRSSARVSIELRLRCPYRYIEHTPTAPARRFRVTFTPLGGCAATLAGGGTLRDASRPPGRELANLQELEFIARGDAEGFLTLQFSEPATIDVQQRGDLRSVVVHVIPAPGSADVVEALPLPLKPATSAAVATAKQRARTEQRTRAAMPPRSATGPEKRFAINLESTQEAPGATQPVPARLLNDQVVYTSTVLINGKTWHRLRLGFFATETEAEAALAQLRNDYPRAWVTRVSDAERQRAPALAVEAPTTRIGPVPTNLGSSDVAIPQRSEAELQQLMDDARAALISGDHLRAIQLYTAVLEQPENRFSRDALEFLGLARERNGQKAHAVAEYRHYLKLYPDAEGAARVRQRLAGLTALSPQVAKIKFRQPQRQRAEWEIYGGL